MENTVLTSEKINIHLNDAKKDSRERFYELNENNGKSVPNEMENPTLKMVKNLFN